uniref:Uncharacterized protein n=1 Tax=Arundo donax TaxID=35708 RepID=A0A0A8ZP31_ARUDO
MFFCNLLVRHLLEGKTRYETVQGSQTRSYFIWPIRLEERVVEAKLRYAYWDLVRQEKNFSLTMMLRLGRH